MYAKERTPTGRIGQAEFRPCLTALLLAALLPGCIRVWGVGNGARRLRIQAVCVSSSAPAAAGAPPSSR